VRVDWRREEESGSGRAGSDLLLSRDTRSSPRPSPRRERYIRRVRREREKEGRKRKRRTKGKEERKKGRVELVDGADRWTVLPATLLLSSLVEDRSTGEQSGNGVAESSLKRRLPPNLDDGGWRRGRRRERDLEF